MSSEPDKLCVQCSKVDFQGLFSSDSKAFWLGTLSTILDNDKCPLCRLILHAVNNSWAEWARDMWTKTNLAGINVWVKTAFWAHCDSNHNTIALCSHSNPRSSYQSERKGRVRVRATLGTDWVPDERMYFTSSYRTKRYPLCELDRLSDDEFLTFPKEPQQDWAQVLQRR